MTIRKKLIISFLGVIFLVTITEYINFNIQKKVLSRFQYTIEDQILGNISLVGMESEMYRVMFCMNDYLDNGDEKNKKKIEHILKNIEKYKVIHEVYHSHHEEYLKQIDQKIDEFVSLIMQIINTYPKDLSSEKIYLLRRKLHNNISNLSKIIEPLVKDHMKKALITEKVIEDKIIYVHESLWKLEIGILLIILIWGIIISYYISSPILKLAEAAEQIGKGNLEVKIDIDSKDEIGELAKAFNKMVKNLQKITVSRDTFAKEVEERKKIEKKLINSLKEKEILLKEVHHRVKNNMQVISSLFSLQAKYLKDKEAVQFLKECQNRIKSMALVHENLYRSKDLVNVNFSDYIKKLANLLYDSYKPNTKVDLKLDVEDIFLDIETAIPCGLIINELVSNAFKHAFPEGKQGEIRVSMHLISENEVELIIQDTGIGLPKDFSIEKVNSLGLKLVKLLTEQLDGSLEIIKNQGTKFKIKFRKEYK